MIIVIIIIIIIIIIVDATSISLICSVLIPWGVQVDVASLYLSIITYNYKIVSWFLTAVPHLLKMLDPVYFLICLYIFSTV